MSTYFGLLSQFLTETETDTLHFPETVQNVLSVNSDFQLFSSSEFSILFSQYPIMQEISIAFLAGIGVLLVSKVLKVLSTILQFLLKYFMEWKQRKKIEKIVINDLKLQKVTANQFIGYYISLYNSIKTDLKIRHVPYPSTFFNLNTYNKFSEEEYANIYNKNTLAKLKSIYKKVEEFEQRELFPEIIENYKIARNSISLKVNTSKFLPHFTLEYQDNGMELLSLQNQYQSIIGSRIHGLRKLIREIDSFVKDNE